MRRRCLGFAVMIALAVPMAAAAADLSLMAPGAASAPEACTPIADRTAALEPIELRARFRDDFAAFDPYGGRWTPHFDHNAYGDWRARTLAANRELQLYVDPRYRGAGRVPLGLDPFRADGGVLALRASPVPDVLRPQLHGFGYMSGMISSRRSLLQRYGYFEVRARVPAAPGAWAAFWLLSPGRWPPEIDVFESRGGDEAAYVHVHWRDGGVHRSSGCRLPVAGPSRGFHSYGVLWRPDSVTFYLDRAPVAWIGAKPGLDRPMYLLANLAVGGWGGTPDPVRYPDALEIDWIAAFDLAGGGT